MDQCLCQGGRFDIHELCFSVYIVFLLGTVECLAQSGSS